MKVVYIHFHLKTGGVTTVLTQQVNAVCKDAEVLVIAGTPPEIALPADNVVVDGLGYDVIDSPAREPGAVADAIRAAICRKWPDGCDLIHIHNALLAKNRHLLAILDRLQRQGLRLFIQIHDFAEDGRPSVYFKEDYPQDCHYGVINSRDYRILLRAGLKAQGLHKLFNMIRSWKPEPAAADTEAMVLYPVRALRRKNIGEAILLSLFFAAGETLAITLPPNSPVDIRSYEGWKEFVRKQQLPVRFDAGCGTDFKTLVDACKRMLTTSIMEGFGFSFLEPWSAAKFLHGRKLPAICRDFEEKGMLLDHLYSRLNVPLDWIGSDAFFERRRICLARNSSRFDYTIDPERMLQAIRKAVVNGSVDFGILDERFQKVIIERIIDSRSAKNRLTALNPWLPTGGNLSDKAGLIAHNRKVVVQTYNECVYRKTLLSIYDRVIHTPVTHRIDKRILLAQFFDPAAFSLLTWGDYAE